MGMPIDESELEHWFTYHSPTEDQIPKYQTLREEGLALARMIVRFCPPSADTTAAVRKVREAIMTANASIACGGR